VNLSELPAGEVTRQLCGPGLRLRTGPFVVRLKGCLPRLGPLLRHLYPATPLASLDTAHPADFQMTLRRPLGPRRWWHPQVSLQADGDPPFAPFPMDHALPLLEWGLNWCIATQAHQYLMLHAAVLERDGRALIMPALPGSGKSTLCAALMYRGWRLLSDEFGLVRPGDAALRFHPLPRPVPLKNESIQVIRDFAPEAVIGPTFPKTRKGDVAHVMAPLDSQHRWNEPAAAGWILFPRFQAGSATAVEPLGGNWTFLKLSGNSFNYQLQGAQGFETVRALVDRCPSHALSYSDLDEAVATVDRLTRPA
jgi:HprK-related kinase A